MDPKSWLMPEESPYAINHSNPILYKDEKGDFGVVGGVFGGIVGGGIDLGGQIISGLMQGQSFKTIMNNVDWADVALSVAEGAVAGATGGISLGFHGAFSAARVAVDVKQSNDWKPQSIFGYVGIGKVKSVPQMLLDAGTEAIGLGMKNLGKLADAQLGIGNKHFGKSIKGNFQQEFVYGGIKSITTELPLKNAFNVIGNSVINNNEDKEVTELDEVVITGKPIYDNNGDFKLTDQQVKQHHEQLDMNKKTYLNGQ